jgi:hypothetical protein
MTTKDLEEWVLSEMRQSQKFIKGFEAADCPMAVAKHKGRVEAFLSVYNKLVIYFKEEVGNGN